MDIELKRKVIMARERVTGLSQEQLLSIGLDEEERHVVNFTGKKITTPMQLDNLQLNRGNPYIASGNMTSMDTVDEYIERLRDNGERKNNRFGVFAEV